jgi:hypothetical protein
MATKPKKERLQCIYMTKKRHQCKRKEAAPGIGFCNGHIDKLFNLKVKPSAIKEAGNGLFIGSKDVKKGEIVAEYSRPDARYSIKKYYKSECNTHKCSEYLYCSGEKEFPYCWDARYKPDLVARYANDSRDNRNNVYFVDLHGRSFMLADRKISAGKEVFCDYGDDYDWSFLDKK